jgi:hypothetical protein
MIVLGVLALFQGITLQTLRGISKLIVEQERTKAAAGYRVEKPAPATVAKTTGKRGPKCCPVARALLLPPITQPAIFLSCLDTI